MEPRSQASEASRILPVFLTLSMTLVVVERDDGAGVNDFAGEAVVVFQGLGGFQGAVEGRADGQDGQVLALSLDVRLAERDS